MKKLSIYLFICTLASLFLFSCTQKTIKTDEKDYMKKFFLTTDTTKGALNIDIEVEIPVAFADSKILVLLLSYLKLL